MTSRRGFLGLLGGTAAALAFNQWELTRHSRIFVPAQYEHFNGGLLQARVAELAAELAKYIEEFYTRDTPWPFPQTPSSGDNTFCGTFKYGELVAQDATLQPEAVPLGLSVSSPMEG